MYNKKKNKTKGIDPNILERPWISSNKYPIFKRELNVDKKLFLSQDEIKAVKDLLKIIKPEGLDYLKNIQTNTVMEWCLKVCTVYDITLDEFRSGRRDKDLVQARTDFCHAVYNNTDKNYSAIARFMHKDHSTVLHHIKKLKPKHFVNE